MTDVEEIQVLVRRARRHLARAFQYAKTGNVVLARSELSHIGGIVGSVASDHAAAGENHDADE